MFGNAVLAHPAPVAFRPRPDDGGATPPAPTSAPAPIDPLADDRADDAPLLTTERRLRRLAIVAADVGARFAREASPHDPVAWMLSPRALFDGERAIDACQDRVPFVRATLLHGLGHGLDAEPEELDALLAADEDGDAEDRAAEEPVGAYGRFLHAAPRLFTCEVEAPIGVFGRRLEAFMATVAEDAEDVRRRVAVRYGAAVAAAAVVREGFDPGSRLAGSLLAADVVRWLEEVANDPGGAAAAGADVLVERRSLP